MKAYFHVYPYPIPSDMWLNSHIEIQQYVKQLGSTVQLTPSTKLDAPCWTNIDYENTIFINRNHYIAKWMLIHEINHLSINPTVYKKYREKTKNLAWYLNTCEYLTHRDTLKFFEKSKDEQSLKTYLISLMFEGPVSKYEPTINYKAHWKAYKKLQSKGVISYYCKLLKLNQNTIERQSKEWTNTCLKSWKDSNEIFFKKNLTIEDVMRYSSKRILP